MQTQFYKLNDARRMAATLTTIRNEQGESIPVAKSTINHMAKVPANVLASYAARPTAYRTVRLVSVTSRGLTLRAGGAY